MPAVAAEQAKDAPISQPQLRTGKRNLASLREQVDHALGSEELGGTPSPDR
jgi:hypothetical protein